MDIPLGGYHEVCKFLIENGVERNPKNKGALMTPIDLAVFQGHLEVCEILLQNQVETSHKGYGGWTLLHIAASLGHLDIIKLLIQGANKKMDLPP